jgi:hypothetical protein
LERAREERLEDCRDMDEKLMVLERMVFERREEDIGVGVDDVGDRGGERCAVSVVYTVNDERFKKDGAVVGFSSEFIDHAAGLRWRPPKTVDSSTRQWESEEERGSV